jgi:hypothetical protein
MMRKAWTVLVLLTLASCGGQSEDPSPTSTIVTTSGPAPTDPTASDPATTASITATTASALPERLVGAWSSSEGDATLAYRFLPDGRYRHAGLLTQPRATGTLEFTVVERGKATVGGSTLILRPSSGTMTRKDPDDPGADYERPVSKDRKRLTWRLDTSGGRDVLYLRDAQGVEVSYDRE